MAEIYASDNALSDRTIVESTTPSLHMETNIVDFISNVPQSKKIQSPLTSTVQTTTMYEEEGTQSSTLSKEYIPVIDIGEHSSNFKTIITI